MSRLHPGGLSKYGISPIWWGYRTPREIIVADVPTAVLYRVLQFAVLLTTCLSLFENNKWAYSEAPDATANIWVDPTDAYDATLNQSDYSSRWVSHSGPAEPSVEGSQRKAKHGLPVAGSGRALLSSPLRGLRTPLVRPVHAPSHASLWQQAAVISCCPL